MVTTTITISGNPIAKARPRFARHGKFVRTYSDQETEESKFLFHFIRQWTGPTIKDLPIELTVRFYMKRPKSHYGTGKNAGKLKPSAPLLHTKKPDLSNLVKFVEDTLNGHAWHDDSSICNIQATKLYNENPATVIIITTL